MTKSETRREKPLAHCTPERREALDKARQAYVEASARLDAVRAEAAQKHADYLTLWQEAVKPLPEREWMLAALREDAAMRETDDEKRVRAKHEGYDAIMHGGGGSPPRRTEAGETRRSGFIHPLK